MVEPKGIGRIGGMEQTTVLLSRRRERSDRGVCDSFSWGPWIHSVIPALSVAEGIWPANGTNARHHVHARCFTSFSMTEGGCCLTESSRTHRGLFCISMLLRRAQNLGGLGAGPQETAGTDCLPLLWPTVRLNDLGRIQTSLAVPPEIPHTCLTCCVASESTTAHRTHPLCSNYRGNSLIRSGTRVQ